MMTEPERAYLAGIIDGEGCITTFSNNQRGYTIQVIVGNTSTLLIDWIASRLEGNQTEQPSYSPVDGRRVKQFHRWYVQGDKALELLEMIAPYLIVKKEQAYLAIDFLKNWRSGAGKKASDERLQKQQEIRERIQALNGRRLGV